MKGIPEKRRCGEGDVRNQKVYRFGGEIVERNVKESQEEILK